MTGTFDRSHAEYYWGTPGRIGAGTVIEPSPDSVDSAEKHLDAGRSIEAGHRSKAVWAASSILDATAMAAIRCYSRTAPVPHEALHIFRVDLQSFHVGPVAIIDELQARMQTGASLQPLIREYWQPTTTWHIREFIAPSLTVLEEVSAATEPEVYLRRWVRYNEDRERAKGF